MNGDNIADSIPAGSCCCQYLWIGMLINTYSGGAQYCGQTGSPFGDPPGEPPTIWYAHVRQVVTGCAEDGVTKITTTDDDLADTSWLDLPTSDTCHITATETTVDDDGPCGETTVDVTWPDTAALADVISRAKSNGTSGEPSITSDLVAAGPRSAWAAWSTGSGVTVPILGSSTTATGPDDSGSFPIANIESVTFQFTRRGQQCAIQITWDEQHYDATDTLTDTVSHRLIMAAGTDTSDLQTIDPPGSDSGSVAFTNLKIIAPYIG